MMETDIEYIKMRCSNCYRYTEYSNTEITDEFPFSRERLICRHCMRPLSITSGMFI